MPFKSDTAIERSVYCQVLHGKNIYTVYTLLVLNEVPRNEKRLMRCVGFGVGGESLKSCVGSGVGGESLKSCVGFAVGIEFLTSCVGFAVGIEFLTSCVGFAVGIEF